MSKAKIPIFTRNISVDVVYSERENNRRQVKQNERMKKLGLAAVHDASFAGQPDHGSQGGYIILLGDTVLYDELACTHLIEWHSGKIQRKVASTLASEANAAAQAYDKAMWARAICYEIEQGRDAPWEEMCAKFLSVLAQTANPYMILLSNLLAPQKRNVLL